MTTVFRDIKFSQVNKVLEMHFEVIDLFYYYFNHLLCSNFSAKDAMHHGRSPIIIDNTNIQAWEMKPYVKMVGDDVTD